MGREEKAGQPEIIEEEGAAEAAARFAEGYIEDKLTLARALLRGRAWAMIAAGTNKPTGRQYSDKLNFWLKQCKLQVLNTLSDNDRANALKIAENEKDFRKKYSAQPANVRQKWNNYSVLWRNYQKMADPEKLAADVAKKAAAEEERARQRDLAAIEERELRLAAASEDSDASVLIAEVQAENASMKQRILDLHELLPVPGSPTKTFERLVLGFQRQGKTPKQAYEEVAKLVPAFSGALKTLGVTVPKSATKRAV